MPNNALIPKRPEFYVQTGSMFENPHGVPHDVIVQYILENPAEVVAQVVFGKYVESSGLVFTGELIQMMLDRELTQINGDRWTDKEVLAEAAAVRDGHFGYDYLKQRFHSGVDFARQTDYTVIYTLDCRYRPARVVHYRRLNRVPWESIYREVGRTMWAFGPSILGDSTGMGGDVVLDALDSRGYCPIHDRTFLTEHEHCPKHGTLTPEGRDCGKENYISLSIDGYDFSGQRKKQLVEHTRNVLSTGYVAGTEEPFGWLRCPPIVQLEDEMAFYTWDDKDLETDCLMGLSLACWQGLEDAPGPIGLGSAAGE